MPRLVNRIARLEKAWMDDSGRTDVMSRTVFTEACDPIHFDELIAKRDIQAKLLRDHPPSGPAWAWMLSRAARLHFRAKADRERNALCAPASVEHDKQQQFIYLPGPSSPDKTKRGLTKLRLARCRRGRPTLDRPPVRTLAEAIGAVTAAISEGILTPVDGELLVHVLKIYAEPTP